MKERAKVEKDLEGKVYFGDKHNDIKHTIVFIFCLVMLDRIKCFFIILLLFSYGNCQEEYQLRGRINATMKDQRIVGGIEATKGAYPWLVQLFPDESWSEYYPNCREYISTQIALVNVQISFLNIFYYILAVILQKDPS